MDERIILEIKTPRTGEETPEAMAQFLASIANIKPQKVNFFTKISKPVSLELALIDQTVHFYINIPESYQSFIESQLLSQYPKALITRVKGDPIAENFTEDLPLDAGRIQLQNNYVYPLKTIQEFKDVDPLSS